MTSLDNKKLMDTSLNNRLLSDNEYYELLSFMSSSDYTKIYDSLINSYLKNIKYNQSFIDYSGTAFF
jgi:hypothetical protein